ncbi:trypsin-like peptidase domain-containing protein [Streptomyces sp. bgisy154]|uniref:VMAP-C domain-containing protein n=1 Tax=Streptomyces sp. bgisy154 TaxID=3413794 RepID=UPI003D717D9B
MTYGHDGGASAGLDDAHRALRDLVMAATVRIHRTDVGYAPDGPGTFLGSGFFIAPNWVLTCAHVVHGGEGGEITVVYQRGPQQGASAVPGEVVATLPERLDGPPAGSWPAPDLALVRLREPVGHDCVYVSERPTAYYSEGKVLYAGWTVVGGQLQVLDGPIEVQGTIGGWTTGVQMRLGHNDLPPGVSGGPVIDPVRGEVIGVLKSRADHGRGGTSTGVERLRTLPVPHGAVAAEHDDVYQAVFHAHDRYHRDRQLPTDSRRPTWVDAQSRLKVRPGRTLSPDERTELLGRLAALPPPVSTRSLLDVVDALPTGQDPHALPAPRGWRDGLGLLYESSRDDGALKLVLDYAIGVLGAERPPTPSSLAAERALWDWVRQAAAGLDSGYRAGLARRWIELSGLRRLRVPNARTSGTHAGPYDGTRADAPDGTAAGLYDGGRAGTPDGTAAGLYDGGRAGTPDGTAAGLYDGTRAGTHAGTHVGSGAEADAEARPTSGEPGPGQDFGAGRAYGPGQEHGPGQGRGPGQEPGPDQEPSLDGRRTLPGPEPGPAGHPAPPGSADHALPGPASGPAGLLLPGPAPAPDSLPPLAPDPDSRPLLDPARDGGLTPPPQAPTPHSHTRLDLGARPFAATPRDLGHPDHRGHPDHPHHPDRPHDPAPPRLSILLEVLRRGWEPDRCDWSVSVARSDGEALRLYEAERTALNELPARVAEPLTEAFRRCDEPDRPATLQAALPHLLLALPVDAWRLRPGDPPLGVQRPVVVRCSDRDQLPLDGSDPLDGEEHHERRERWRWLHAHGARAEVLDCDEGIRQPVPDIADLRGLARRAVPVLCRYGDHRYEDDAAALVRIVHAGFGVALWRRRPGYPDTVCGEFHRGARRAVDDGVGAALLPDVVHTMRTKLRAGLTEAFWADGIALYYDDPHDPLPGTGDLLEAP